ncbi:MAG: hypothetical protein SNJ73_03835, partial [Acetobacteraceae bacterium]
MSGDRSAARGGDQARGLARSWCAAAACLAALALQGCGPRADPIEQVRVIAGRPALRDLPPVPGADDPYPTLGSVPARPRPPPPEERRRIADATVGEAPLVAIDQEGGRVQRLGPPVVQLPPMRRLGELDDVELTRAAARALGRQLAAPHDRRA